MGPVKSQTSLKEEEGGNKRESEQEVVKQVVDFEDRKEIKRQGYSSSGP